MSWSRQLRAFVRFPWAQKMMYTEAYVLLAWGRVLKALPFAKVAPSLGSYMKETPEEELSRQELLTIRQVSKAVHGMSRYTWWESQCLVKAIAAMKMLERRGLSSTLYLGSGRDEQGRLAAHAWLRCGSYIVTGREGHEKYTVVGIFGNGAAADREAGLMTRQSG
ncbi:lasso peptide biosynthesis B2 protein [Paenibacillus cellulositrophicus]|uniref:lasso peptide biosynthesis B2 protein n=1 Tax=Paenibacillus cellulositrophicus TaxID=562959 RepID=UPI003D950C18